MLTNRTPLPPRSSSLPTTATPLPSSRERSPTPLPTNGQKRLGTSEADPPRHMRPLSDPQETEYRRQPNDLRRTVSRRTPRPSPTGVRSPGRHLPSPLGPGDRSPPLRTSHHEPRRTPRPPHPHSRRRRRRPRRQLGNHSRPPPSELASRALGWAPHHLRLLFRDGQESTPARPHRMDARAPPTGGRGHGRRTPLVQPWGVLARRGRKGPARHGQINHRERVTPSRRRFRSTERQSGLDALMPLREDDRPPGTRHDRLARRRHQYARKSGRPFDEGSHRGPRSRATGRGRHPP